MDWAVAVDGTLKQPTRAPENCDSISRFVHLVGPLHRFRAIADMPVVGRGSLRSCGTLTAVRHAHTQNAFNKYCAVRLREVCHNPTILHVHHDVYAPTHPPAVFPAAPQPRDAPPASVRPERGCAARSLPADLRRDWEKSMCAAVDEGRLAGRAHRQRQEEGNDPHLGAMLPPGAPACWGGGRFGTRQKRDHRDEKATAHLPSHPQGRGGVTA